MTINSLIVILSAVKHSWALSNGKLPSIESFLKYRLSHQGVGKLSTLGYHTYNTFKSEITGALNTEQTLLMHEYGLVAAGYNIVFASVAYNSQIDPLAQTFILDEQVSQLRAKKSFQMECE
jgi:hypothetical protein